MFYLRTYFWYEIWSQFDGEFANVYCWKYIEFNVVGKKSQEKKIIRLRLTMQTCEPPKSSPQAPFIIKRKTDTDNNVKILAVPVWDDPFKSRDPLPPLHSVFADSYNLETREFSCINSWVTYQPTLKLETQI